MTPMKASIISNNVDIVDLVPSAFSLILLPDAPAGEVLAAARDRVHLGAKLLAHPMAGRLRPNETPYRTVVLQEGPSLPEDGTPLDLSSFEIIEYCLAEESKYASLRRKYDESLLPDLRFIDCELFRGILRELD